MRQTETYSPETLDEVAALLLAADGQPRPRVRGATLCAQTEDGGGSASILVDLARVPEMNRLEYDERSGLVVGTAVLATEPLGFPPIQDAYAILADGLGAIGPDDARPDVTLGELLEGWPPAVDLLLPLICLGASVTIFGPHGWSEMTVEALCAKRLGAAMHHGEFLVGVRLPAPFPRSGGAYLRSRSVGTDGGAAGVGAFLLMEEDRVTCCGARVTVWAGDDAPLRALEAERFLRGKRLSDTETASAGELVPASVGAPPHGSGGAAGRRDGLATLAGHVIRLAFGRAHEAPRQAGRG
jgi:CO/xanthine dehydrogenase FAD-binding subunit